MAKFAAVLIAVFAFQAVWAAPNTQPTKTTVEDLTAQIETASNDFAATLEKHFPDAKEVKDVLTSKSAEFTTSLESLLKKVQTEIDSGKGNRDELLKGISGKLSEGIASLQNLAGPDATKKTNEIKADLETSVKNLATYFENFGKTIQPNLQKSGDDISNFATGLLGDFLQATKQLQTEVKDAVEKH